MIEYAANESGGRIAIRTATREPDDLEILRQKLLESAAAIRRGDLRGVRVMRSGLPALKVLEDNRLLIRCTYRTIDRGAELVLLSDDADVIAAIHAVLAAGPPRLEP